MKKILSPIVLLITMLSACGTPELPENYGKIESRLYLGEGENQPLIVGLGGAEGGNA